MSAVFISRIIVSFSWLFHGLVPKLIYIAPLEYEMTSSLGFSDSTTLLLIKCAGISEILFGLVFWFCYRNRFIVASSIAALLSLIVVVAVLTPHLLFEAFNPITTNIPLVGLSLILWYNCNTTNSTKNRTNNLGTGS